MCESRNTAAFFSRWSCFDLLRSETKGQRIERFCQKSQRESMLLLCSVCVRERREQGCLNDVNQLLCQTQLDLHCVLQSGSAESILLDFVHFV